MDFHRHRDTSQFKWRQIFHPQGSFMTPSQQAAPYYTCTIMKLCTSLLRDWCWSWNSNTLATWCGKLTHLKRPWFWERLRAGGEGDNRGWDGWMILPTQWTWVGWTLGVDDGQGGLVCCGSWGRKESDTTERLNWTELVSPTFTHHCICEIHWSSREE